MKRFIIVQTIFVLILGVHSFAHADYLNKKASPSNPGLFSKLLRKAQSLEEKTDTGTIQYKGFLPLEEVLKDISVKTGITFILANSVSDQTVYAPAKTINWKSAVKQLLRDYSTLQIWSDDLAKSRIWIFGQGQYNSTTSQSVGRVNTPLPDRTKKVIQTSTIRAIQTFSQPFYNPGIQKTVDNSFYKLPPHIRHDPEVLRFLHSKRIELPEEIREKYGEDLEYLPSERPMFRHVRNHPLYKKFLQANGL